MHTLQSLANGNPGAATFLMNLMTPDVPIRTVTKIENSGIIGADLYVLWSDLCGRNMDNVVKLMDNCPFRYISY